MKVTFFCHSCGARFEVDAAYAGKSANCRNCGQRLIIPRPQDLASAAALPVVDATESARVKSAVAAATKQPAAAGAFRLEPAAAPPQPPVRQSVAPVQAPTSWIEAVNSQVGLAPISSMAAPKLRPRVERDALADSSRSALYAVVSSPALPVHEATPGGRPNMLQALWRGQLGWVQSVLRWINDATYLVSIPFLFMILLGAVIPNRGLALFAATLVVLLNIGRLATGLFNLVLAPFREGIVQGIMFLIPPMTFIYLARHWKRLHRSVKRIIEPAVTIALVFLAFTFVPSLSGGNKTGGPLLEQVRQGAEGLTNEIRGEVGRANIHDLNSLAAQAKAKLQEVEGQVRDKLNQPLPGQEATQPALGGQSDSGQQNPLRVLEQQVRDRANELQNMPERN